MILQDSYLKYADSLKVTPQGTIVAKSYLQNPEFNQFFFKLSYSHPFSLTNKENNLIRGLFWVIILIYLIISYILLEVLVNSDWTNIAMLYGITIFPVVMLIRNLVLVRFK